MQLLYMYLNLLLTVVFNLDGDHIIHLFDNNNSGNDTYLVIHSNYVYIYVIYLIVYSNVYYYLLSLSSLFSMFV